MYHLIIYQMAKSGRWRWKFAHNNRILARAEYSYKSKSATTKAFNNIAHAMKRTSYSTTYENA